MKLYKLFTLGLLMSLSPLNTKAQYENQAIHLSSEEQAYVVRLSQMNRIDLTIESSKQTYLTTAACGPDFVIQLVRHFKEQKSLREFRVQSTLICHNEASKLAIVMNGGAFIISDAQLTSQLRKTKKP
ncbi:MAG: hypothetical protein V4596_12925 [Bdellovibrionota bacterium]